MLGGGIFYFVVYWPQFLMNLITISNSNVFQY